MSGFVAAEVNFCNKTRICKLLKLRFYSHFRETVDHERFWVYWKNDEKVKKTVS